MLLTPSSLPISSQTHANTSGGSAPLATSVVPHGALVDGGHLSLALGAAAGSSWGTGANTPSSACAANPPTADLRMSVRQVRGARHRVRLVVSVRNAGDTAADGLRLRVTASGGWAATRGWVAISALDAGRSTRRTWNLRARPHSSGSIRAEAQWNGGNALRAFATTTARAN